MVQPLKKFKVYAALKPFEKANDPERRMWVGGIVSTGHLDKQDEEVVQTGLNFRPFLDSGWFNDNHGQRTADVLGYPTDARYVKKGEILPNGDMAEENGWYAEGYLCNTDEGRRIFALAQSLEDSPRQLGFSIEGGVDERDRRNRSRILRATVRNVAITHCPVNDKTRLTVQNIAKALSAGHAVGSGDLNQGPGDGGSLRPESLEGADDDEAPEEDDDLDPEGSEISKAEDFELEPISMDDLFEEWAPALNRASRAMSGSLTKAEAAIYVRDRHPHLTSAQVREILDLAGGTPR